MKIKRGDYFRSRKYRVLGRMLEQELETFFQAEDMGASKGRAKDLLQYMQHEVEHLPQHIRQKILLKLQANAQSKESILQYIYNYILCCSGDFHPPMAWRWNEDTPASSALSRKLVPEAVERHVFLDPGPFQGRRQALLDVH